MALLTLSWDKNWDSHSPMNGYPSFYPRIALVALSPGCNAVFAYRRFTSVKRGPMESFHWWLFMGITLDEKGHFALIQNLIIGLLQNSAHYYPSGDITWVEMCRDLHTRVPFTNTVWLNMDKWLCPSKVWNEITHSIPKTLKWRERERLSLSAFLRTEDIGVHIVHISCLIINLYIGIIIFPHIDNPQSTGYN